jgi:hypothetical protein
MQTATEKHKSNVPETMNEFLDMSDDEGKENAFIGCPLSLHFIFI